jgi:hypothetical protein
VVYGLAGCVRKWQVRGVAGLQRLAQPSMRKGGEVMAADSNDADRTAPGGAGNGDDRVGVGGGHRFS